MASYLRPRTLTPGRQPLPNERIGALRDPQGQIANYDQYGNLIPRDARGNPILQAGQVNVGATRRAQPQLNKGSLSAPPVSNFLNKAATSLNGIAGANFESENQTPDASFSTEKRPSKSFMASGEGMMNWQSPEDRKAGIDAIQAKNNTPTPTTSQGIQRSTADSEPSYMHTSDTGSRLELTPDGARTNHLVSSASSPTGTALERAPLTNSQFNDITEKYGTRDAKTGLPMQPRITGDAIRDDSGASYNRTTGIVTPTPQQKYIPASQASGNNLAKGLPQSPVSLSTDSGAGVASASRMANPPIPVPPAPAAPPPTVANQAGAAVNKVATGAASNVGTSLGQSSAGVYNYAIKPIADFSRGLFGGGALPDAPTPQYAPVTPGDYTPSPGMRGSSPITPQPIGSVQPNPQSRVDRNADARGSRIVTGGVSIYNPNPVSGGMPDYRSPMPNAQVAQATGQVPNFMGQPQETDEQKRLRLASSQY